MCPPRELVDRPSHFEAGLCCEALLRLWCIAFESFSNLKTCCGVLRNAKRKDVGLLNRGVGTLNNRKIGGSPQL